MHVRAISRVSCPAEAQAVSIIATIAQIMSILSTVLGAIASIVNIAK